ncbi:MAG: tetratricopeptide repeat protein, partial [Candidatus Thorarchaeota archaeon]
EKAKGLINSNTRLVCFQPLILMFEGHAQGLEENRRDGVATCRKGLELAKINDDKLYMYLNFESIAFDLIYFDIQESLDLFQEMYDLAQDLHVPYMIAEVLFDSALAFEFAGEYDLAISSFDESVKILGGGDTVWTELSKIYAALGDGQKALEWANQALEDAGQIEYAKLYLRKAWALALLNRVEEAERNLDTAHSLILKTGVEARLGVYYHVAGVIESAKGDYQTALDFLEKSLEILDRLTIGYQTKVLVDLARVEILIAERLKNSSQNVAPGKWLTNLEKYATDYNLPGIRMQAALLKSEFYHNNGQLKDAHAILIDALTITDSLGVKTLRRMINERIRELGRLLNKVESSSKGTSE